LVRRGIVDVVEQLHGRILELKKKVHEKRKATGDSKADHGFREIRKKLKRLQRNRRRLLARSKKLQDATQVVSKEKPHKKAATAPEKPEAAPETKS
jgi:peptidoglycan hydrolase CwlO-like protein